MDEAFTSSATATRGSRYDSRMRTRAIALVLVGILIIVSDTLDAIGDGLSGWNVVTIALGVFLLVSGLVDLRRLSGAENPSRAT